MHIDQLTPDEENRIAQDHLFYEYQNTLNQAKRHAGIKTADQDYQTDFNIISRIDWLKRIDKSADQRLMESYEKQTSHTGNVIDFNEAKQLIYNEEGKRKELHILRDTIKIKLKNITQSRKGMPLMAAHWNNYEARINRSDYDLSFLSTHFHKDCNFKRIQFDQADYQTLSKIYNSFLSPGSLIHALSNFLGVDFNRVVIALSNPRFTGFECWLDQESEAYTAFKNCDMLEYIPFDDSFIIKYGYDQNQLFVESEAFKSVDVWVDPLTLEIFVHANLLPLNINRDIKFPKLNNIEYIPLVAFDYNKKAWEIDVNSIIKKIQSFNNSLIIRDIFIFNGNEFELIPSEQNVFWTFANSLLFSLNNTQGDSRFLFIYDCENDILNKYEYRRSFTHDDLIHLFSDTLKFLKIAAFELHSPDKMIESFLNSEKTD